MSKAANEHKTKDTDSDATETPHMASPRTPDAGTSLKIDLGVTWYFADPVVHDERTKNNVSWQDE